ncbi:MAG: discoidin domain-containing protein [Candidatus Bipolaricaulia bacterium]
MRSLWMLGGVLALLTVGAVMIGMPGSSGMDSVEPAQADANAAESFFDDSDVRVHHAGGQWMLRLDTPEAVLCSVNFGLASGELDGLTAMNMTAPAEDHDIALPLEAGRTYQIVLTAFTTSHEVLRSPTYVVEAARADDAERDRIVRTEGEARVLDPAPAERVLQNGVEISDAASTSATVSFATTRPTLASVAFGPSRDYGRSVRGPETSPFTDHRVDLLALEADTDYHAQVVLIDERANVFHTPDLTFSTSEAADAANETLGENVALLSKGASIRDVSSNWQGSGLDGSFGANNAIDGDPSTEWSSDGDGNDAWIEIQLDDEYELVGVGVWTRTMTSSAQISKFRVLTDDGTELGTFELPDAKDLYQFEIPATSSDMLRFEVVESSGGNTGARSVEIYRAPTDAEATVAADVVDVSTRGEPGDYTFEVTVKSPDTGCDQYADWWEVLSTDGELLHRRILAHSHVNEQPFTRSGGPVAIDADETVIVRAHMNPTGYGGQAMRGSVDEGFQTAELPADFAADVEDEEPQPSGCAF